MENLQKMLNSNENFELDDSFLLNVVHVRPPPRGSGPKTKKKQITHVPGHLSNMSLKYVGMPRAGVQPAPSSPPWRSTWRVKKSNGDEVGSVLDTICIDAKGPLNV